MDKSLTDTSSDLIQLFIVSDPIEYILGKTIVAEPRTRWYYSGEDVNLLGEIIRKAVGLRIDDFAEQYFFPPTSVSPNMEGIMQFRIT